MNTFSMNSEKNVIKLKLCCSNRTLLMLRGESYDMACVSLIMTETRPTPSPET